MFIVWKHLAFITAESIKCGDMNLDSTSKETGSVTEFSELL